MQEILIVGVFTLPDLFLNKCGESMDFYMLIHGKSVYFNLSFTKSKWQKTSYQN